MYTNVVNLFVSFKRTSSTLQNVFLFATFVADYDMGTSLARTLIWLTKNAFLDSSNKYSLLNHMNLHFYGLFNQLSESCVSLWVFLSV